MKLRISGLLAIAAFAVACLLGNGQSLAQNAYITNQGPEPFTASTVSVIDPATNAVTTTIPVGPQLPRRSREPGRQHGLCHELQAPGSVSVIDTATNTVIATIPVGLDPIGVAVTPDGSKVYVANAGSNTVSVIDTATNTVIATIPGRYPPLCRSGHSGRQQGLRREHGLDHCVCHRYSHNTVIATIPVGPLDPLPAWR